MRKNEVNRTPRNEKYNTYLKIEQKYQTAEERLNNLEINFKKIIKIQSIQRYDEKQITRYGEFTVTIQHTLNQNFRRQKKGLFDELKAVNFLLL